ncbi:MAG: hypothetical protein ACLGI2_09835 [Acidimicrobiia bacterium]
MRRVALVAVLATTVAVAALVWAQRPGDGEGSGAAEGSAWAALDAQARCDQAVELVTHPDRWPLRCRWRAPGEQLVGQAYPPPAGEAPFDAPRVEIYVAPEQSREDVARAIAHELGHMHHTRRPTFVADWLAARNLDPATPSEVWTEDYAEVFAALFAPPSTAWRAPTPRPSPGAVEELKARFFAGAGAPARERPAGG